MEKGGASIIVELTDGNITVRHGTEGNNAILLEKKNVKEGAWDKIWETLNNLN